MHLIHKDSCVNSVYCYTPHWEQRFLHSRPLEKSIRGNLSNCKLTKSFDLVHFYWTLGFHPQPTLCLWYYLLIFLKLILEYLPIGFNQFVLFTSKKHLESKLFTVWTQATFKSLFRIVGLPVVLHICITWASRGLRWIPMDDF